MILNIHELQQDVQAANTAKRAINFPPLTQETRSHVDTACAAFHLSLKAQTLRKWACFENGVIHPRRIGSRLSWSVADLKKLLNGGV